MREFTVFISSTFEDLTAARRKVYDAILGLGCRPNGMECFGSADRPPWERVQAEIDSCDCFIVIVAGRYGDVGADGMSFTEREYDYAVQRGKPILTFLHRDIERLEGRYLEKDPIRKERLDAFRSRCKRLQCTFWESNDELDAKVTRSIAHFFQEKDGYVLGRTRGFTSDGLPDRRDSNIDQEVRVVDGCSVLFYARRLKMPRAGVQTLLSWSEFGYGIELLMQQIRSGRNRFVADAAIGLNETGLAMASFLSGALMHHCPIGFLRRDAAGFFRDEWLPVIDPGRSVLVLDSEIKTGSTLKQAIPLVRARLRPKRILVACLGVQTLSDQIDREVSIADLMCRKVIEECSIDALCAAFVAPPPSLDPPLYLD